MAYDGQLSSTQDGFTATRPASRHIKGATLASRLPAWVLERARANGGFEMPVTETSTGNAGNRTADAIVEEATRAMMKDNERWKQASTKSIATGMTVTQQTTSLSETLCSQYQESHTGSWDRRMQQREGGGWTCWSS